MRGAMPCLYDAQLEQQQLLLLQQTEAVVQTRVMGLGRPELERGATGRKHRGN